MSKYIDFFKKAFSGEETDFTKVNIRSAVLLLAIPMMLEMAMESVFALVDLYFVGHLKESGFAIQTVGLTESVLSIMYSIAIGMSMAATALVARRIGEKNPEQASRSAAQVLLVSFAITFILSLLGVLYAEEILILMGSRPEAASYGKNFTRIMMGSSTIIMLLFLINGIFRGAGNAMIAMKSLWIANIANIILCPVLIKGLGPVPALGLTGAALATTIGRSVGVIYQLYHLLIADTQIRMKPDYFKPYFSLIKSIVKIATPGIFQFVIASCSWIFLAELVATTGGENASAGYQTALRLMMFFMLPAWGLSNAASTLVGQNMGANEMFRAEQSVMKTVKYNVIFMLIVSLIFIFMGNFLVSFFTQEVEIKDFAKSALYIMSTGFIFYGIGMVMINAFNGAGDTWTPTWVNLFGFWLFQIPLAYFLSKYLGMGPKGVFISIPAAETLITIIAFILFKKGKWKTIKV
ncbi:MATE family efflux transporter [Chryseobacterium indologenes]|uniref:MATE family efflux transporter n=2 Tax=Chryseobacterium indologenes TaxID=253 RepID=UPI000F4DC3C6|nr:MATE family efflux transporter [Chryseobacterium indologenes]AYZ34245.1 MATE family efflux transporter [Chryseobacterium indologenes]MBF6642768.1 MATE family efflux transporter [Chryseobacterium indologenes]MEB4762323.1 MATE family efflux transporter [Chryseobacterium indologenes]QQQ69182.1 MATE family efflux transporter [Chryseobacterium indologenes]